MGINLYTDYDFLNTEFNEHFLSQYVSELTYNQGDIICNGSQFEDQALNIIASGSVRIVRPSLGNKKNVATFDLKAGAIFGIGSIICNGNDVPVIASALEETLIYRIHAEDLEEQLKSPKVLHGLFNQYIKTMNSVIQP